MGVDDKKNIELEGGENLFDIGIHESLEKSIEDSKNKAKFTLSNRITDVETVEFNTAPSISHIDVLSSGEKIIQAGVVNEVRQINKGDNISYKLGTGRRIYTDSVERILESGDAYVFCVTLSGGGGKAYFATKKQY